MSVRLKLITAQILALLILLTVCLTVSFLLFWTLAAPFCGPRLDQNISHIAGRFFAGGGVAVLLLTCLGALYLTVMSAKTVLKPLARLKVFAKEIREGNLDYQLPASGSDEFFKLGYAFEQMRVELKNLTLERQIAERERSVMMASICHDLRTPITSILGYAEGIIDGVAGEKTFDYAAVIKKKALALQRLSEDLSLMSKLETSQLVLSPEEIDMGEFIENTILDCEDISFNLTPGLICSADKDKMARVLMNLIENCHKYGCKPDGSCPIDVGLCRLGQLAHITVSDRGAGLSKSELSSVYNPFYRVDTARSGVHGSGLGLSIVRQIVTLHDGKTWTQNRQGGGLTVSIQLPLKEER